MGGRGCCVPIGGERSQRGRVFQGSRVDEVACDNERRRGMEDVDADVNSSLSEWCEWL